jgi:cytoskeletal protein CcmA (bactofilin family)
MDSKEKVIEINIEGSVEGDLDVTGERIVINITGDVSGNVSVKQAGMTTSVTIDGEPYKERE